MSKAKVKEWYAPTASLLGYNTRWVKPGSLILYREPYQDGTYGSRLARVLDEVEKNGCGEPYKETTLRVLAASSEMNHGYERHVRVSEIAECFPCPQAFAAVFFHPDFPFGLTPERIVAASRYGTLNESFIEKLFSVKVAVERTADDGLWARIEEHEKR